MFLIATRLVIGVGDITYADDILAFVARQIRLGSDVAGRPYGRKNA